MAGISVSIGNQLTRMSLAAAGAKKYAAQLPKETAKLGSSLGKDHAEILALNAKQEGIKAQLAKITQEINARLKSAGVTRAKVVRMAEATFGPKAAEISEFRPKTEGKVK